MEHKNRRTHCRLPTHRCDRCNKGFVGYQSFWKHKQRCKADVFNKCVLKSNTRQDIANNVTDRSSTTQSPSFIGSSLDINHPSEKHGHYDDDDNSSISDNEDSYNVTESSFTQGEKNFNIADYAWRNDTSIKRNHSILLPRNIRAIIFGKSGCGKTTLLTSLLLDSHMMDYDNLMVCGNSLHQPEYRIMKMGFDKGTSRKSL